MTPTEKHMTVTIENQTLDFAISGETYVGDAEVLLHQDIDMLQDKPYHDVGFQIFDILNEAEFQILKTGFTQMIACFLGEAGVKNLEGFELIRYHEFANDEAHSYVVKKIQHGLSIDTMPLGTQLLDEKIGEILGFPVESINSTLNHHTYSIRIVRPSRLTDNNPPHRDVWLDHLRNAVNIYLPICGSDVNSALPILPGSHLWKESEIERTRAGAVINGVTYTVPCVVGSAYGLSMKRPNPKPGQAMLFSPYLVHGGGYNLNTATSRVSLEMRFWKKN
jgi:hypothetical protein